jgi:HAD superfamily hydrolase (TIGR01549 family)
VINAVLFDWRWTVFADEDDRTWIRNSAASVGRELSDDELVAMIDRLRKAEAQPHIAAALAACDTSLEVNRTAMLALYQAAGLDDELAVAVWERDGHPDSSFPYEDTRPVFEQLRQHDCKIGIVSDIHYDIREHFRRHDLDRYVDAYILSFEHNCQKPDPRIYELALSALEAQPEQALMVGDRASHDGAAVAVGIPALILPTITGAGVRGLDLVLGLVG